MRLEINELRAECLSKDKKMFKYIDVIDVLEAKLKDLATDANNKLQDARTKLVVRDAGPMLG